MDVPGWLRATDTKPEGEEEGDGEKLARWWEDQLRLDKAKDKIQEKDWVGEGKFEIIEGGGRPPTVQFYDKSDIQEIVRQVYRPRPVEEKKENIHPGLSIVVN